MDRILSRYIDIRNHILSVLFPIFHVVCKSSTGLVQVLTIKNIPRWGITFIHSRGGKYSEEDAKAVMVQILSIVSFCHLQGVVHRDLKPEVLHYSNNIIRKLFVSDFFFFFNIIHFFLVFVAMVHYELMFSFMEWILNCHLLIVEY